MADTFKYVQAQNFSLSGSGVVIGATSIVLKSFAGIDGTLLTMNDFGTIGFGTLEPGNGILEEQISFTGVTQNSNGTATLTGVSSVLFIAPYTATSGVLKTHAGSTVFVISNTSGFYDKLTSKSDDETITGLWVFPSADPNRAGIGSDVDTAVATAFVTLGQLSRQAISGASNASTTVKGIVELATQAELDARTTTGGTGALLVPTPDTIRSLLLSDYKADTGAANAYVITPVPAITAYTAGQIFSFKATSANTTASTININALGVKSIKRMDGSALLANDIRASQIVVIEYDGTNFIMISPTGNDINFDGSGLFPANNGSAITNIEIFESLPRGETINGATTPVPVVLIDDTFQEEILAATDIDIGKVTTGNKGALGFKLQGAVTLTTAKIYLRKQASPTDNIVFTIQTDTAGAPSGTPVANGTASSIAGSGLTTSYVLTTITFGGTVTLAANTQYWLVGARDSTTSDTNYYKIQGIADSTKYGAFTGSTFNASSWSTGANVPYMQLILVTGSSLSVWKCDTDHANFHIRFGVGFVNTDGAISVSANVIFRGVLAGFTGLVPNALYFAQDTAGTIGVTRGTTEVLMGRAITPTKLFVNDAKGMPEYIGSITITDAASTDYPLHYGFQKARMTITALSYGHAADAFGSNSQAQLILYKAGITGGTLADTINIGSTQIESASCTWTSDISFNTSRGGITDNINGTIYFYK